MDASLIYQNLAVIAAFLLIYSLIAGRFESRLVNGPLLFMLVGWLLGQGGVGLLSLSINSEGIKLLAELSLVIVLFNDAANTNWQVLQANRQLPIRLLLIGLPLTLVCGALFGHWLFPNLPLLEMAILSTILAPTDAALGKAVVSNPVVPAPVREGLNQESGLNDGICVPVLLLLLALIAPTEQHAGTATLAITLMLEEIGIGLLVAFMLTSLTIRLLKASYLNGWQRHRASIATASARATWGAEWHQRPSRSPRRADPRTPRSCPCRRACVHPACGRSRGRPRRRR